MLLLHEFWGSSIIKGRMFFMNIMAFNGSPRKKNWNTVTLLNNVLEEAVSAGADTELIHLYDLHFPVA